MAAAFRPVNTSNTDYYHKDTSSIMHSSPATPRPNTAPQSQNDRPKDDGRTPTRVTFSASNDMRHQQNEQPHSDNAHSSSTTSPNRDSMDVDMEDSDNEAGAGDDNGGSDGESVNGDGTKSKKKKSQRFYCTDFPPCNLSFTRSEHLARHIRKHTGERPFQCHCSRRFSRLDNLRQHAQTVHVNEDIPNDSLAATGSRFQRQMRTDRVRQAGNRARASTSGSAGGPSRGHSKSLSTSSINSMGSMGSVYGTPMHADRRRPAPLVMPSDPRSRMSIESYRSGVDSNYSYRPHSPSDFSTPTSATFSTAQSSPRWPSGMASPTTSAHSHSHSHTRSQSMYMPDQRRSGRRLSVPSGIAPFQSHGPPPGRLAFGPALVNSSNAGAFSTSNHHTVASPAGQAPGWSGRRDSTSSNSADDGWRRRTWHPDSRVLNGQQPPLNAQSTVHPNPPPPMATPATTQFNLRLPGIESFDPLPQRPPTPPRRTHSPMVAEHDMYQLSSVVSTGLISDTALLRVTAQVAGPLRRTRQCKPKPSVYMATCVSRNLRVSAMALLHRVLSTSIQCLLRRWPRAEKLNDTAGIAVLLHCRGMLHWHRMAGPRRSTRWCTQTLLVSLASLRVSSSSPSSSKSILPIADLMLLLLLLLTRALQLQLTEST
ncbi:hypothetical protein BB8028_0002g10700 [Beauveria bassiana]|uniref:C2H2-type domain-containing protein n=1 Tax=Beauveria bassiana TaxID=176275 RepID=A0A2S7Y3R5_BEABA|nr:hypothetical protein BB8028_0002g10700 [Beauveria bassiana]